MTPRLLLLIPPGWNYIWQPHLSLPSLAAYLRSQGCQVWQHDLNLAFFESLTNPTTLTPLHGRMIAAFRSLDEKNALNSEQQRRYTDLAWCAQQSVETLAGNLRQAMAGLRDPAHYYHLATCARYSALLNQVWEIVWATFSDQPEDRVDTLLAFLSDEANNPFLPFVQDRLLDLLASSPHVAVISVYYPRQLLAALTLGDQLKKAAHRLHIILEGRAPTALASLWHSHPELFRYFDSVVIGQSDRPVSALARCEVEGGSPSQVPGLIYRERGEVRTNAEEAPEAMEILPPPDFDGLPLGRYLAPHPVLPLQAAQGCYWGQCRFCAYNAERHFSAYRPHSAQWLVTAMEQLATRYNAVHFTFADEAVSPDLLEEVAREIVRRGLKVWWQAQTRPEAGLTPERCRLLAQSGCVNLQFCFETASDALAQRMRMGLSRTERKAALVSCARAGILTHVFVVLGLPGERSAEADETAAFVLENQAVIHGLSVEPYMLGNYASLAQHLDLSDVRLSLPRPDDLAPHRTNWKVAGDMSQTEVEERCQTLRRVVQRRFPAFAASYFPALLYATHYHSRDLTDLVRHSQEHSFHDKRQGDGQHPRRRSEVVSGVFRFDLAALKYHSHGSATPLQHPAICLLDGPSGPVLRVPARIAQVLMLADGTRSQETIAQTLAARVGTSEAVARTECMTLLRLYGTFLEQTDG